MPRHTADNLPEPGDDSAVAEHIERVRSDPDFRPAPQPEPGEQPDPPKGTAPDASDDAKFTKTQWVAVGSVGRFSDGQEIEQGHWSPARLRKLRDQGLIREKGK